MGNLGWSLFSKSGISSLPTPGFVRFREETHWVKLFANRFIFTRCSMTLKFHEMSYNNVKRSIYVLLITFDWMKIEICGRCHNIPIV